MPMRFDSVESSSHLRSNPVQVEPLRWQLHELQTHMQNMGLEIQQLRQELHRVQSQGRPDSPITVVWPRCMKHWITNCSLLWYGTTKHFFLC